MASTDVARVVPSQTSPAPAKLVKWSDRPFGCVVIVGWVVVAFILQEFCVTRRVDWPAGADGDRRDGAWITITSWRIASVVLAAGTCLGLALVHSTAPGVVPPNTRGVEPDVAVMAVDANSGDILWESKGYQGIAPKVDSLQRYVDTSLTVGGGQVFLVDQDEVLGLDLATCN